MSKKSEINIPSISSEDREWLLDTSKEIFLQFFEQRPVTNEQQLMNVSAFSAKVAFQLMSDVDNFGKEKEYDFSELGLVTDKSVEGMLVGHLVLGAEEVGEVGRKLGIPEKKLLLLRHMLLSHHGTPEFGAAVIPSTAEAELLSYIDLLDSRMEIYAETFETLEPGRFSDKVFSLDKKIYNHGLREGDKKTGEPDEI